MLEPGKVQTIINAGVREAKIRFVNYDRQMLNALSNAVMSTDKFDLRVRNDLIQDLKVITANIAKLEAKELAKLSNGAVNATGYPNSNFAVSEILPIRISEITTRLEDQARRNSNTILAHYGLVVIQAEMTSGGSMKYKMIAAHENLKSLIRLTYTDKIGRKSNDLRYVELTIKQGMYSAINEIAALNMKQAGIEKVRVYAPGHSYNGEIINLSNIAEIKDKYFHPNSEALILAV